MGISKKIPKKDLSPEEYADVHGYSPEVGKTGTSWVKGNWCIWRVKDGTKEGVMGYQAARLINGSYQDHHHTPFQSAIEDLKKAIDWVEGQIKNGFS